MMCVPCLDPDSNNQIVKVFFKKTKENWIDWILDCIKELIILLSMIIVLWLFFKSLFSSYILKHLEEKLENIWDLLTEIYTYIWMTSKLKNTPSEIKVWKEINERKMTECR